MDKVRETNAIQRGAAAYSRIHDAHALAAVVAAERRLQLPKRMLNMRGQLLLCEGVGCKRRLQVAGWQLHGQGLQVGQLWHAGAKHLRKISQ